MTKIMVLNEEISEEINGKTNGKINKKTNKKTNKKINGTYKNCGSVKRLRVKPAMTAGVEGKSEWRLSLSKCRIYLKSLKHFLNHL